MASLQQLAPDAEEVLDESMHGQESLRLTWRFELSHLPLTLPRRLVRDFGAIILCALLRRICFPGVSPGRITVVPAGSARSGSGGDEWTEAL